MLLHRPNPMISAHNIPVENYHNTNLFDAPNPYQVRDHYQEPLNTSKNIAPPSQTQNTFSVEKSFYLTTCLFLVSYQFFRFIAYIIGAPQIRKSVKSVCQNEPVSKSLINKARIISKNDSTHGPKIPFPDKHPKRIDRYVSATNNISAQPTRHAAVLLKTPAETTSKDQEQILSQTQVYRNTWSKLLKSIKKKIQPSKRSSNLYKSKKLITRTRVLPWHALPQYTATVQNPIPNINENVCVDLQQIKSKKRFKPVHRSMQFVHHPVYLLEHDTFGNIQTYLFEYNSNITGFIITHGFNPLSGKATKLSSLYRIEKNSCI